MIFSFTGDFKPMFSGIVEARGTLAAIKKTRKARRLWITVPDRGLRPLKKGQSVAVNGVCLSVMGVSGRRIAFDVIPDTLRRTNLGTLVPKDRVNLEPSPK